uniref:Si:dkey-205h13.1 n=1 Tax=Neogobius melanostomus TaxID=47308 RepID=A0A8C6WTL4_9GOBI
MILLSPSSDEESLELVWHRNPRKFSMKKVCFSAKTICSSVIAPGGRLKSLPGKMQPTLCPWPTWSWAWPPSSAASAGAKLDDFADFTTFGIATSLLLRTPNLMDNLLCMCYVLSVFVRLCFYSSGIPFMYRGLPCLYPSGILASASLLSGGNMVLLRVIAVPMILAMISQSFYPHDRILESQPWKKAVYAGGVLMVFCSSFSPACIYYLLWSASYFLFPMLIWSNKV